MEKRFNGFIFAFVNWEYLLKLFEIINFKYIKIFMRKLHLVAIFWFIHRTSMFRNLKENNKYAWILFSSENETKSG